MRTLRATRRRSLHGALVLIGATLLGRLPASSANAVTEPIAFGTKAARESARLYATGRLNRAVEFLQRANRLSPRNGQLHFMLGNALFRRGNWAAATGEYEEARRLRPWHIDTLLCLGHSYLRIGRLEDAKEVWRAAARDSPRDALPHLALAAAFVQTGNVPAAKREVVRAQLMDPAWRERLKLDIRWRPDIRDQIISLSDNQR